MKSKFITSTSNLFGLEDELNKLNDKFNILNMEIKAIKEDLFLIIAEVEDNE